MCDGPVPQAYFSLAGAVVAFFEKMPAKAISEESFAVWMLLSVSYTKSRDDLVFRDRHQRQGDAYVEIELPAAVAEGFKTARRRKVLERAVGFYRDVFAKRLVVIPSSQRKGGRTKSHRVFQRLVRWAEHQRYWESVVERRHDGGDKLPDVRVEKALQRRAEPHTFSKGSGSPAIIEKAGRLWLVTHDGVAPVPEEFSLSDCVGCLPLLACTPSDQRFNDEMITPLADLLDSAGERYQGLRRCGLDPDRWFDEPKPTTNQLRALVKLSLAIRDDPEFHPGSSLLEDAIAAHWATTPIPAVSLEEFLRSAWGQEFIKMFSGGKKRHIEVPYFDDETNEVIDDLAALEDEQGDEPEPTRTSARKMKMLIDEMVVKDWLSEAEARYLKMSVLEGSSDATILQDATIQAELDAWAARRDDGEGTLISVYGRRVAALETFKKAVRVTLQEYLRSGEENSNG